MSVIWSILRGPFILPENTEKYHTCLWEKIDFDKAGCLLCGRLHICDSITCKDVSTTNESVICNVTGCVLRNVLVTNQWCDTCMPVDCKTETPVQNDIETYIVELLMSSKTKECLVRERRKIFESLEARFVHEPGSVGAVSNAIDSITSAMHKIAGRIPADFDTEARQQLVCTCLRFISPVVASIQGSQSFRSFKYNTRQLVFGLIYLMRSGVYSHSETILPKIVNMQFYVPRECYLRVLFEVSPSIITDTENKLKFLVRHGYIRSALTRS
jgi:UL92 family